MASKLEYLQRYMGSSSEPTEKKLRKRRKKDAKPTANGTRIVDEDHDWTTDAPSRPREQDEMNAWGLTAGGDDDDDDAPVIVAGDDVDPDDLPVITNAHEFQAELAARAKGTASTDDLSPPRRRQGRASDDDASPPRRQREKKREDDDASPPRRRRSDSDGASPPRRRDRARRGKDDNDASPPRRQNKNKKTEDEDASPPRRRRQDSDDESPPRRRRQDSDDASPPRRRPAARDRSPSPSPRRDRRERSPARRRRSRSQSRRDRSSSPPRDSRSSRRRSSSPSRGHSKSRRSRSKSPRRRASRSRDRDRSRHRRSASPDNRRRGRSSPRRSVSSSLRREKRSSAARESSSRRKDSDASPPRRTADRGTDKDAEESVAKASPKEEYKPRAGLFTAEEFADDLKRKTAHNDLLKNASAKDLGHQAETVYRDKKGRKLDMLNELVRQQEILDGKRESEKKDEYEWGTGRVQKEEKKSEQEMMEKIKSAPFARRADDAELEAMRRERVRAFDPINSKLFQDDSLFTSEKTKKHKKHKSKKHKHSHDKSTKPKYAGPPAPPNRFNVLPGYRWDGVVRGTGWEEKLMLRANTQSAQSEDAYRYATADM